MYKGNKTSKKNRPTVLLTGVFFLVVILACGSIFFSCKNKISSQVPLTEFIYYSEGNGPPADYLKIIKDKISVR